MPSHWPCGQFMLIISLSWMWWTWRCEMYEQLNPFKACRECNPAEAVLVVVSHLYTHHATPKPKLDHMLYSTVMLNICLHSTIASCSRSRGRWHWPPRSSNIWNNVSFHSKKILCKNSFKPNSTSLITWCSFFLWKLLDKSNLLRTVNATHGHKVLNPCQGYFYGQGQHCLRWLSPEVECRGSNSI